MRIFGGATLVAHLTSAIEIAPPILLASLRGLARSNQRFWVAQRHGVLRQRQRNDVWQTR
ncbi:MAG: hypothetical protein K2N12_02250 [Helicobacter sp.]|nr:hypothetical protein [Helicobacter sp.]